MDDISTKIMAVVVAVMLIAVGFFVIAVFVMNTGTVSSTTETFPVTNPSVDQTITLSYTPSAEPTVWQYNGISWNLVSATFVSYNNRQLTVLAGGLQG